MGNRRQHGGQHAPRRPPRLPPHPAPPVDPPRGTPRNRPPGGACRVVGEPPAVVVSATEMPRRAAVSRACGLRRVEWCRYRRPSRVRLLRVGCPLRLLFRFGVSKRTAVPSTTRRSGRDRGASRVVVSPAGHPIPALVRGQRLRRNPAHTPAGELDALQRPGFYPPFDGVDGTGERVGDLLHRQHPSVVGHARHRTAPVGSAPQRRARRVLGSPA